MEDLNFAFRIVCSLNSEDFNLHYYLQETEFNFNFVSDGLDSDRHSGGDAGGGGGGESVEMLGVEPDQPSAERKSGSDIVVTTDLM